MPCWRNTLGNGSMTGRMARAQIDSFAESATALLTMVYVVF
jgi:hypothetical protein